MSNLKQKGIAQIFLIFILTGIIAGTYITYRFVSTSNIRVTPDITTPEPSETPIPEASREGALSVPYDEPKVVSDEFVVVTLKEGTDITQFAKRYNIDENKIEGFSRIANVYRIPVLEGEDIVSTRDLFRKDPDVVSASFELYAVPH